MQWPPTPGPGAKRMKPNGFVAAASMTSQTSMPMRSHSSASSLTRAMLTFRKTFSSSFASSATSGEESSITCSFTERRTAAARLVARGFVPPTRRGTAFDALAGSPGFTRSGANARSKSAPARRPLRSSTSRNGPVVVPGKVVDCRIDQLAGPQLLRDAAAAEDRPEVRVLGAGEWRRHADEDDVHRRELGGIGRDDGQVAALEGRNEPIVVDIVDRRAARSQLVMRAVLGVQADDLATRLGEGDREGQSDVAQTDDGDPLVVHSGSGLLEAGRPGGAVASLPEAAGGTGWSG